jgi:cytochrome P450
MIHEHDQVAVRTDMLYASAPMTYDRAAGVAYFQDAGPVFQDGNGLYYLTTSEGVQYALQNPKLFSSAKAYDKYFQSEDLGPTIPNAIDPPDHVRYRRILDPLFAPRVLNPLEDELRRQAGELIDAFADKGECDVMTDLAKFFPPQVFMTLFGLPLTDRDKYWGWARTMNQNVSYGDEPSPELVKACTEVIAALTALVASKRKTPGDDIVSRIMAIDGDDAWTDNEIVRFGVLFANAGLDTVAATMGFVMHYLATNPDVRQSIVDDPERVAPVLEEIMRLEAIGQVVPRLTTREVTVSGCRIPADSMVLLCLGAANRDPERYPQPGSLDVGRSDTGHFTFGGGIHRCIGSHLARRELRIMVEEFHKRIPVYELASGVQPTVQWPAGGISFESLPLVFPLPTSR